jgi:hypothetical protein
MKLNIHTIGFGTLLLFIAAVTCEGAGSLPSPITGTVSFSGSGASLTPGEGWYRCELSAGQEVFLTDGTHCGPVIANESGMLTVSLRDKQHSSLESMAASMRAECDSLASADKHSFHREKFVTEGGLRGLHVSYVQRNVQPDGRVTKTRCHHYLVNRADGRGVDIAYLANSERESKSAHEMIRKSLNLQ